ncbi:MAG: ribosome recycling factor [Candidatus Doudnabacteria bacterium RIFCSPHIGHO2_01_FULL_49_9]|uniref:Ribosome-recycling factor n=1 Tax=Candidatus Doudnabacteria bacterium RIFCSPHIGHO2_01_FULL_49_9 TaxID=1817827 RepID=A0A1F5P3Y0_9BACT|nr:MAG: ribosome recycling factor [Candidatus Doudnabacteria bacterium RIFCSPHIGHO2_01_FULL_49_9]
MTDDNKQLMEAAIQHLQGEFSKLRTGRANPGMIESVKVNYYGTPTALNALGSITVPERRQLVVQTWDKNALPLAEKAIRDAGLGLNPTNEGDKLRIAIPELTEERRRDLLKIVSKEAENARIKIRGIREEAVKAIKQQEESGKISEDDRFRKQEILQKLVDEFNQKIKDLAAAKEQDMMKV